MLAAEAGSAENANKENTAESVTTDRTDDEILRIPKTNSILVPAARDRYPYYRKTNGFRRLATIVTLYFLPDCRDFRSLSEPTCCVAGGTDFVAGLVAGLAPRLRPLALVPRLADATQ